MECDHIKALDLARDGNWDESHKLVQQYSDKLSCLIHAYLHRVEGDIGNAQYWYSRAGEAMPNNTLDAYRDVGGTTPWPGEVELCLEQQSRVESGSLHGRRLVE